jgi:chloride channel 3/4/5
MYMLSCDSADCAHSVSFKRKNKATGRQSLASRFLSSPFANNSSRQATPSPSRSPGGILRAATPNTILSYLNTASDPSAGLQDAKDGSGLDWYVEGPGRRVGYDNLTAIDWIYEYSKERTRLRQLTTNNPGVVGHLKVIADASQIWWILVATGLAVGGIAAGIDVASDWLGDVKTGMCSNVEDGGKFYLNRAFCCWETNTYSECHDWRTWATAMGVGNKVGSYIIEYFFFICFSVRTAFGAAHLVMLTTSRSSSPHVQAYW